MSQVWDIFLLISISGLIYLITEVRENKIVQTSEKGSIIMNQINVYFFNGLGGTKEDIIPLKKFLDQRSIHFSYLPLPGHESAKETILKKGEDFLKYYGPLIGSKPCILIGYSIGAEVVVFLSQYLSNIKKIILIDGGLVCGNDLGIDVEKDIQETLNIIEQNQITSLNPESISWLLGFCDSIRLGIMTAKLCIPVHLIMSMQKEVLAIKKKRIAQLTKDNVTYSFIENSTHKLITEYPMKIAQEIRNFI